MRRTGTYDGYRRCDPCHRRLPAAFSRSSPLPDFLCLQHFRGVPGQSWQSATPVYQFADRCAHTGSRRADIKIIRITEFRRIARKVRLLEIDTTDDRLFVLTRWDLGTDPLEVLDALTAAGLAGR